MFLQIVPIETAKFLCNQKNYNLSKKNYNQYFKRRKELLFHFSIENNSKLEKWKKIVQEKVFTSISVFEIPKDKKIGSDFSVAAENF